MPTTYIDNTIDIRFSNTSDSTKDSDVDFVLADTDNIGATNIPIYYTTSSKVGIEIDKVVEVFVTTSGYTEDEDLVVEYLINATVVSGVHMCWIDYYSTTSGYLIDYYINKVVEYYVGPFGTVLQNTIIDFTAGQKYNFCRDVYTEYWTTWSSFEDLDYVVSYTRPTKYIFNLDRDVDYCIPGSTASGSADRIVDVTFTGWVLFDIPFDLYCGIVTSGTVGYEVTTISGGVIGYYTDIFSTASGTKAINYEAYCCLTKLVDIDYEVTVISGSVDPIDYDLWCTVLKEDYVYFDVSLLSLKISNFSLAEEEYTSATDSVCVDVTDDWYNVVVSGTYFNVNGTQVSGTYTPIVDGYRMCYDPADDFESLMGPTTFTVHAENDNGDVLERDYYLTYGYKVEFENLKNKFIDFGYETKVVVRTIAENLASCPKESSEAYWFETRSLFSSDLACTIIGDVRYSNDLSAQINAQTTAYYYGKECELVVTARDFAGNIMTPFVLIYTIEDGS